MKSNKIQAAIIVLLVAFTLLFTFLHEQGSEKKRNEVRKQQELLEHDLLVMRARALALKARVVRLELKWIAEVIEKMEGE